MQFPWNPNGNTEYFISDYIREFQRHTSLIDRTCKAIFPTGVPDMLLLTCFLQSLRQQVKFKMILELLDLQKDLTLEVAMTALKSRSEYDTEPQPPSAFYNHSNKFDRNTNGRFDRNTNGRFDRNTNGRTRREGRSTSEGCFICGDYGHMKHQCQVPCRHCKRTGHKHASCFHKPGGKFNLDGKTPFVKRHQDRHQDRRQDQENEAGFTSESYGLAVEDAYMVTPQTNKSDDFYVDSGCSDHIHKNRRLFDNFKQQKKLWNTANGLMTTQGVGQLGKVSAVNHGPMSKNLFSVGRVVDDNQSVIFYGGPNGGCDVIDDPLGKKAKQLIADSGSKLHAIKDGALFRLPINNVFLSDHQPSNKTTLWHKRLGHVAYKRISKAIQMKLLRGVKDWNKNDAKRAPMCSCCGKTQCKKRPFPKKSFSRATKPAQRVGIDNCGPISPPGLHGEKHITLIQDQFSGKRWSGFPRKKSESLKVFQSFETLALLPLDLKVGYLRCDGARELVMGEFKAHANAQGIIYEQTVAESSSQNFVERGIGVVTSMTRSLMEESCAPAKFWPFAVRTAVFILNRLPSEANPEGKSPQQLWDHKDSPPSVSYFRVFGCLVYFLLTEQEKVRGEKFKSLAIAGAFIGYETGRKGYLVWDPIRSTQLVRRNVYFDETRPGKFVADGSHLKSSQGRVNWNISFEDFSDDSKAQQGVEEKSKDQDNPEDPPNSEDSEESDDSEEEVQDQKDIPPIIPRRSSRATKGVPANKLGNWAYYTDTAPMSLSNELSRILDELQEDPKLELVDFSANKSGIDDHSPKDIALLSELARDVKIPHGVLEAQQSRHAKEWLEAITHEGKGMLKNKVFTLCFLPPGKKTISYTWVFKVKERKDGGIERFRARLCARGFSQIKGQDYGQTFSPVAREESIKLGFSIAATLDMELRHIDFEKAFLNADVEHEIFMDIPRGLEEEMKQCEGKGNAIRLNKCIYGLKQAGRKWFLLLISILVDECGFTQSPHDPCVFVKKQKHLIFLILVVDDLLCADNSPGMEQYSTLVKILRSHFIVKDMPMELFVGMTITRNRTNRTIKLGQTLYIQRMLSRFNMDSCKPVSTPATTERLTKEMCQDNTGMASKPYRSLVMSLLFAARMTRIDVSFAVIQLSKFLASPGLKQWQAAKRVLRYLSGTMNYSLQLGGTSEDPNPLAIMDRLYAYSDSDWAGDPDTSRSTGGNLFMMGGPVSHACKLQRSVAHSSTEAEYVAAANAAKQATWLRGLALSFGLEYSTGKKPLLLLQDNQSAIAMSLNSGRFHPRTKHIAIRHHYLRDEVSRRNLHMSFIPTTEMLADILTKPLGATLHRRLTALILHID